MSPLLESFFSSEYNSLARIAATAVAQVTDEHREAAKEPPAPPLALPGTPDETRLCVPRALDPAPNEGDACRTATTAASSRSIARAAAIFSPSRAARADRRVAASLAPAIGVGEAAPRGRAREAGYERGSHELE